MLSFNMLLDAAEIPVDGVSLLRHQDLRMQNNWDIHSLWRQRPDAFALYEATQARERFQIGGHVASFVVEPDGHVVFVGLSAVLSCNRNEDDIDLDFIGERHSRGSIFLYDLERDPRFADYEGRLVIDWGPGARSWCQNANRQNKPIIELRRDVRDVEWPGYMRVVITEDQVKTLAPNWRANLEAAKGVYLLTCPRTGAQYVGVAFGDGGFLGRWLDYSANSHGGNRLLMERCKTIDDPLQISILEVFGSTVTNQDAYEAEARWKRTLGSRAHGLNAN